MGSCVWSQTLRIVMEGVAGAAPAPKVTNSSRNHILQPRELGHTVKFLSLKDAAYEPITNLIKTLKDDTENRGTLQAHKSNKSKFGRNSFVINFKTQFGGTRCRI